MTLLPEQVFEPATGEALVQDPLAGSEEESPDTLDPDILIAGVEALRRFLRAVDGHIPESDLVRARTVVELAGERLELSRDHTVVALVGATGSGKSSMFNALAGLPLSPVGVRRPTTSLAHACTWGASGAGPLLDWLGVQPSNRFNRESALDGDELMALRGLILLDLPDFDSIEGSHRDEVDRLLRLVDLVIWVLDPQKYADSVLHDQYLQPSAAHRDITLVVLNQVDTLGGMDTDQCIADLRRLLDADGLTGVPLLPTSTVREGGLAQLRSALEAGVAAHEAFVWRLAADLKTAVNQLWPLVATAPEGEAVDRGLVRTLVDTMAASAGVPAMLDRIERDYLASATAATGWLVPKWIPRFRHDPSLRLPPDEDPPEPARELPEQAAVQRASAALAARELAELAAKRLPAPWSIVSVTAALARQHDLAAAITAGIAKTDLAVTTRPRWWRTVGLLQWVAIAVALVGLGWFVTGLISAGFGATTVLRPRPWGIPLSAMLLCGGLALGLSLTVAVRPMIRFTARAARVRAHRRLHSAIAEVASDLVVAPVRGVLRSYSDARAALSRAR